MQDQIVIIGAGVVGLDVAYVLAQQGYGSRTTVVAEHMPGDTSTNYTSPWAGANFSAISGNDKNALAWDKEGYRRLLALEKTAGPELAIKKTQSFEYWDEKPDQDKIKSLSDYLEDFSVVPQDKLIPGTVFGVSFNTFTINAPKHIVRLRKTLESRHGVKFIRRQLDHIDSGFLSHRTKIVFNCTGNAARTFAGVEDSKCFPTRGQILLTRAPQIDTNVMRHGKDYETYIIPRPYSNGNVILGGFMQKGNGTGDTFAHETESIWNRTSGLQPLLKSEQTEVLAAFAGLRPSRQGGARVESEERGRGRILVHNYGAGGTGYQAGMGMAAYAVGLAGDALNKLTEATAVSKL